MEANEQEKRATLIRHALEQLNAAREAADFHIGQDAFLIGFLAGFGYRASAVVAECFNEQEPPHAGR